MTVAEGSMGKCRHCRAVLSLVNGRWLDRWGNGFCSAEGVLHHDQVGMRWQRSLQMLQASAEAIRNLQGPPETVLDLAEVQIRLAFMNGATLEEVAAAAGLTVPETVGDRIAGGDRP